MSDYYGGRGRGRGGGGFKRRREEEVPMDPMRILLANLMKLGDDVMPTLQGINEENFTSFVKNVKRAARENPAVVRSMLIDCALQISTKVPLYALIIGLVNVDEPAFVAEIVSQVTAALNEALKSPSSYRKARSLLRLLAALTVPGVLNPSSVVAVLKSFVDAATNIADAKAGFDDNGRTWQPYADYLVYMAMIAVPFGGIEMADGAGQALNDLVSAAEAYLERRPRSTQPGLRPFAASIKEDDLLAETDNGGASFLPEAVSAVKEMVGNQAWELQGVPRVHIDYEATLATAPQSHTATVPTIPDSPPVATPEGASDTLIGALVLEAFPPRGIIRFLDAQHTLGDRPVIERIVAEDYIIDTVAWFEGDRVECAKHLARYLPLPYSFEPLLCEVLFSQMLRLPNPEFKPIMYSTLMVELCKLLKMFPRAMSACVRESFGRLNVMDPALRERLAEWLAYHLSNFEYVWPWQKWEHVLQAPEYDGQRRFCVAVMNRMCRLSYWEQVHKVVPEEFRVLLPAAPVAPTLPAPEDNGPEAADREGAWAAAVVNNVRSRMPAEALEQWITQNNLENILGGKIGVLRVLARGLLVVGAKSYTHMITALERYYGPLALISKETGLEGQVALIAATAQTWLLNPQRAVMTVDRLMTLRLVSAEAIITWVFGEEGVRCIHNQSRSGMAWEMLRKAVHKCIARVDDATEDLEAGKAAVEAAKAGRGNLQEAEGAMPEKEAYLEETTTQQQGAILQVLRSFTEALGKGGFAGPAEGESHEGAMDAHASEATILHDYLVASLRSFLREYHVQAVELEQKINEEVVVKATDEIKDVLESQLRL